MTGATDATRAVADRLGHVFGDERLLVRALTHPSYRHEHPEAGGDNQRLEFLGDAVLDTVIADQLVARLPEVREGTLTVVRAHLVCEPALAARARGIGVGDALRLGRGERAAGGADRDSLLADAFEALLGAVFRDAGYAAAEGVILAAYDEALHAAIDQAARDGDAAPLVLRGAHKNWRTALQERLQALGAGTPRFRVVGREGPDHAVTFVVEGRATWGEQKLTGRGEGSSKKAATFEAARVIYEALDDAGAPT
jgi:ribonuclease-3